MRVSLTHSAAFSRVEAVKPPVDVPGREDFGEQDGGAQHQVHGGENDGERALSLLLRGPYRDSAVRMVTNAMEPAPPTRKYEIMSGSTNAALRASAVMPRPKSQTMYLTRTSPMMRDRNVDAINTRVAVNAVCACDGRSAPRARAHRLCGAPQRLS